MDNVKKTVMCEVHSAEEVQALVGCTITTVSEPDDGDSEGLCLDCKDKDGNLVSFLIMEDGSWHWHNSKDFVKKNFTTEQYGAISQLVEDPMVDCVNINNFSPMLEIVIKVFGDRAANRVLTKINSIFPMLEIGGPSEWTFEGKPRPMYSCYDPTYIPSIVVGVMPDKFI